MLVRSRPHTILLTGASGYLGRLIAAEFLADGSARLVIPLRSRHKPEHVIARLAEELDDTADLASRLIAVTIPESGDMSGITPLLRRLRVDEIVNCAGCVSYFALERLKKANVDFTARLLSLGALLGVRRFVYLSSAFSSGYVDGVIHERLHSHPPYDPCAYTRSKREAERLVAASGLPYLIIRPSIVIGDSRDGHYGGGLHGLYQLWAALTRFLGNSKRRVIHGVAPELPLPVVHQDAFQAGFMSAYRQVADDSVIHIVSRQEGLPTVRDLWASWASMLQLPWEFQYYDRLADIALDELDPQQQCFLRAVSVNLQIASHRWNFETRALDALRDSGASFQDATMETVETCQRHFISTLPEYRSLAGASGRRASAAPRPCATIRA